MCKLFIRNQFNGLLFLPGALDLFEFQNEIISPIHLMNSSLSREMVIPGVALLCCGEIGSPTTPSEDAKGERQIDIICNRSR